MTEKMKYVDKSTPDINKIPCGHLPERYPRTSATGFRNGFPECAHPPCKRMKTKGSMFCKDHAHFEKNVVKLDVDEQDNDVSFVITCICGHQTETKKDHLPVRCFQCGTVFSIKEN